MSFSYGFFNAQNLDRVYTAEDFTAYLSSLICNGILDTYRQCFAPTVKNLSVTFGTGKAWIDGHYFISDTLHTIDLSSYVDESLNRYVAIGIYCDRSTRTCGIRVLAGWFCQYHLTHFIRTRIMQRERYDHSRAFFELPEAAHRWRCRFFC